MFKLKRKLPSRVCGHAVRVERSGARTVDLYKALQSDNGRHALDGIVELGRDAASLRGFERLVPKKG